EIYTLSLHDALPIYSSVQAIFAGTERHRRVALHAHSIIRGCSGSRAESAQRGIVLKRAGSRAMNRFDGNTAPSSATSPSPEDRRVQGTSTPRPPAISATPLAS